MTNTALITGVSGQDGYYLTCWLINQGYSVFGVSRGDAPFASDPLIQSAFESGRFKHLQGDVKDGAFIADTIDQIRPNEIYNLAAQSNVARSFQNPEETLMTNSLSVIHILTAMRQASWPLRLLQAGSCEMFGNVDQCPQSENTPFTPRSPYGASKLLAYHLTQQYRDAYGLFVANAILYPHESPRRTESFLTRKITSGVAKIYLGLEKTLWLGNLDAVRDWGYSGDVAEAMWLMLRASIPDDYIVATGKANTVRDILSIAFSAVGLDWQEFVKVDPSFLRPLNPSPLVGDTTKIQQALGWSARTSLDSVILEMLNYDLELLGSGLPLVDDSRE